jgi:hypothetical protein
MVVRGQVPNEGQKEWNVPDGVCGFAWIKIRPATQAFAKWIKKEKDVATVLLQNAVNVPKGAAYDGGIDLWVSAFGQSMERKEQYAAAFAEVLRSHGIKCSMGSRMD